MSFAPGTKLGPYEVLAVLGSGGMADVYRARDTRLGRDVALKVLPEMMAANAQRRERFWQEARSAAQVSHANACRLYDVTEERDRLILVMELVEGETLAQRLTRGPLSVRDTAQISLAVLSALEAFHRKGIIHRDLKPENIVLSPSGAKILDFGIAKHAHFESETNLVTLAGNTLPGEFLGTPRYAAPEQFRGEAIEQRTDIFSVGAILFEMLTGQPAFSGNTFGEIAHSVLHVPPPALVGSPAIATLGRIVHTALARLPQQRYASAEKMAEEIRASLLQDGVDTQARAQKLQRVMVLPFRLLRPNESIGFLVHSLPEAISVSLAGLDNLVVRSSLAAAKYGSETPNLDQIAKEAQVDVILTGALLPVAEQVRLTAQLVEVPSGTLLWSHSSQIAMKDLLELHDDLVRRVVDALLPSFRDSARAVLQQDRPASPTVYQLYLRANEIGRDWTNMPSAIELYEKCVSIDPKFASAWARLGRARWLWDKYQKGSLEGLRSADEAFQRAFHLNPDSTMTHHLYTHLQVDQGQTLPALRRLLKRAREHRGDAELFAGIAHICRYCGLLQPALLAHQEARRLDPQVPTSLNHTLFMLGDYERALEFSRSDYGYGTGVILSMLGRNEEAIATLRTFEDTRAWRLGRLYLTTLRALLENNREEFAAAADELLHATFRDPEGMFYFARVLARAGSQRDALDTLARAVQNGFFCYPAMVRDPWLDPLRGRAEFSGILQEAQQLHLEAQQEFLSSGGNALLGVQAGLYSTV